MTIAWAPAPARYSRTMRRIERLINLVAALLETRRPMTAQEIRQAVAGYDQDNVEAFRRTFERDKEALRNLGIPVEVHATDTLGREPDGYVIPKERYYLPELDLEPDEFLALALAADAIMGSAEAARAGLMKLSVEVDGIPSQAPRVVWGADVAAEDPFLGPIYEALTQKKPVRFEYKRAGAEGSEARTVEPYGLVHRRGHWYLVGRDRGRDAVRSFKVTRIAGGVEAEPGTYEIPEGFDAAGHLGGEAWEVGNEVETATVRFDPNLRWWAEQNLPRAVRRDGPGGALDMELAVANVDAFVSWIIGFGDGVEILSPEPLRTRLIEHLEPFSSAGGGG